MSSLNVSGNLDCGGGIAINGSNVFYDPFNSVDASNKNKYLY